MAEKRVFEGGVNSDGDFLYILHHDGHEGSSVTHATHWLRSFEYKRVRLTVEVLEEEKSDG